MVCQLARMVVQEGALAGRCLDLHSIMWPRQKPLQKQLVASPTCGVLKGAGPCERGSTADREGGSCRLARLHPLEHQQEGGRWVK